MSDFDVVVIGGGLAGSAAAIALGRAGWRVALLEQHHHPRHKMCGEFLSPETITLFQWLGVWEQVQALQPALLSSARITAPNGQRLDIDLPGQAMGLSRYRLDHLLLEQARAVGVAVFEGCTAREVHGSLEQCFQVTSQEGAFAARVVLGAWGKRSTMDRTLKRPFFAQRATFLALKVHLRGPEPEERVELHAFRGGYCGLSHIEGGTVNACLLTNEAAWERSGREVEHFWEMIQGENRALAAQLAGAERLSEHIVISNISFAPRQAVEQDILMLGDSAALISPLAGNGQAMALQAAQLAAPLVEEFLRGSLTVASLQAQYAGLWQRQFRERLLLGRLLQPFFLHPGSLAVALHVAAVVPGLASWLVQGTRERGNGKSKVTK
ncbi:MAG: FAD-dependent monooxygenase [Ardenticatenales bacterium]|nr:FAD-dependent monooxygenase [Ardenticatenales bacterium]